MKPVFLIALICTYYLSLYSQQKDAFHHQQFIKEIITPASQYHSTQRPSINTPRPAFSMPFNLQLQPAAVNKHLQQQNAIKKTGSNKGNTYFSGRPLSNQCKDTSFSRLLGVENGWLYIQSVTQTSDGGMLVPALMYDSTRPVSPFSFSYGLLIKLDQDGNVVWLKQFADHSPGNVSLFSMNSAYELPNQDIICAGSLSSNAANSMYITMIYRLTPDGNIIWQNGLESTISIFNSPQGTLSFDISSAVEGLNGDVILCGTTYSNVTSGHMETVVRVNSLGKVVWDGNYGDQGTVGTYLFGAEGVTAFVENGQIMVAGVSHGITNTSTAPAVSFLTLDYANGKLLKKRFFRPDYADPLEQYQKGFNYYANKCTRLTNGHILFYGKLISDFLGQPSVKDHFGVIEFDATGNLVNSYTISSGLTTNYYNNVLQFDPSGKGLVSLFERLGIQESNIFFGAFQDQQFQKQRKAYFSNVGLPGNNGLAFLKNNGYAFIQTYFQNQPTTKSYFEFRKMHNSDPSSLCLGRDTSLLRFLPLRIIEDQGYNILNTNEANKMVANPQIISQTDTTTTNSRNTCIQVNYCDTIKIHGNPLICGGSSPVLFTAFKNSTCGLLVEWNVDNKAIDSLQIVNDSTTRIWFKNSNWQGKLYARIPGATCFDTAEDSLSISIVQAHSPVNLGADTVLCAQNSIVLHAGNNFSSYQWQDGSTDSVYKVATPGMYWVQVSDGCGNIVRDSIMVNPLTSSVNIGPDTVICYRDTLQVDAPVGFIKYNWAPDYKISSTAAQRVIINPMVDTSYFLKAEKFPGCFAYDTIHVKVKTSFPIDLGVDKNFCEGDSAVLNAGAGFLKYQWSNGSATRQVAVYSAGNYSVIATSTNGCKSFDTLRIANVWPTPVVNLDDNPSLCVGAIRTLQAGNYLSYRWQDGSGFPTFIAGNVGTYYVTVTDSHQCSGSDTVRIISLVPPPVDFLPADTAVCPYDKVQLTSRQNFVSYLWSNGQTDASITITQPGLYRMNATDRNGCTGIDSVLVRPNDCIKGMYVPTAFSPNMDGKNDIFKPLFFGNVIAFRWTIYNRYGQMVFTSDNPSKGWNGALNGKMQNPGSFAWVCQYQLAGETEKVKTGSVVLVK